MDQVALLYMTEKTTFLAFGAAFTSFISNLLLQTGNVCQAAMKLTTTRGPRNKTMKPCEQYATRRDALRSVLLNGTFGLKHLACGEEIHGMPAFSIPDVIPAWPRSNRTPTGRCDGPVIFRGLE